MNTPPGVVIGGRVEDVPTLNKVENYKQRPMLKLQPGEDMRARHTRWVRAICLHNTKNIETKIAGKAMGRNTKLGDRIARLWATDGRHAGAHLSVDWDGTVSCHADLLEDAAYHAGVFNDVSIGIEIYEDSKGKVYGGQLDVVVALVEWLCARFRIQRQMPLARYDGPIRRVVYGGEDCVGVFGHCHQYAGKQHDPGRSIFKRLASVGFHEFDFNARLDLMWWRQKQEVLGGLYCDGIPGPKTCDALQAGGCRNGLWA